MCIPVSDWNASRHGFEEANSCGDQSTTEYPGPNGQQYWIFADTQGLKSTNVEFIVYLGEDFAPLFTTESLIAAESYCEEHAETAPWAEPE